MRRPPVKCAQKMWNVVKGTSKYIYVSNPARGGGLHNYGLAVDISILDEAGNPLPMGTKVDHLGPEAHITNEAALVQSGKMTKQEQANRQLLRSVMRTAGFRALPSEWWHFNWCSRQEAKQKYRLYHKVPYIPLYLCRQTGVRTPYHATMKQALKLILSTLFGACIGFGAVVLCITFFTETTLSEFFGNMGNIQLSRLLLSCILSLTCLILAVFVQIILHEAGSDFGLATGYRFVSFRVGQA